ncbi:hypothetical protein FQR65_LT08332 [Abscondita terminalis]|nr:hypothetical protein FQR65_LT08332 [Abscondita terminalis]
MLINFLILLIFGSMGFGDYVPICQNEDLDMSACLLNFLIYLKPYIKEGIPEINFPSFDPLVLKNITIKHSSNDGHFTWTLNNCSIYYLHDYEIISVRQNGEYILVDFKLEKVYATLAYTAVGEILNMPMNGEGYSKEWYGPIFITIEIMHNIVGNNEIEFCNIADVKFQFDIKNMYVSVRGLQEQEKGKDFTNR